MNALILAGSRGAHDPLALAARVRHKTLLPIQGQPMLLGIVRTLLDHPSIDCVHVSIEDEDAMMQVPELAALMREGIVRRIATGNSPAASLAHAITEIGIDCPLLVTTGDHPLLTMAMVDAFLAGVPGDCDFAAAVAPGKLVAASYPGAIRTFYRLGGRRYSGCNLFLARNAKAARVADYWQRLERFRKRPLRLIWEVGPLALIGIVSGLMDLDGACRLLSARVGARIASVELQFAEAAIDVDTPEDWRLVEEIFAKREGNNTLR